MFPAPETFSNSIEPKTIYFLVDTILSRPLIRINDKSEELISC